MKWVLIYFFLILSLASFADGWTPKTYQIIVVNSVKLMPGTFRKLVLRHKEEILSGCLNPDDVPEANHNLNHIEKQVLVLTKTIPESIQGHRPFREVLVDFGRLSHYMCDLNDPLLMGDADPKESQYHDDFPLYMEKQMNLFPWVFDGHTNPLLEQGHLPEYLGQIASNTVEKYPRIGEAYFPNGTLVSSDTFDPKSLPFGIASLSYSRSITNTVQIWFYTWRKAHGDVTNTPFYSKSKKAK